MISVELKVNGKEEVYAILTARNGTTTVIQHRTRQELYLPMLFKNVSPRVKNRIILASRWYPTTYDALETYLRHQPKLQLYNQLVYNLSFSTRPSLGTS